MTWVQILTESHILQISDLAKYPGFGHRDDEDEQTFSNEEEHRENLIADCMRESGFDYTPAPSIVLDESVLENEKEFERLLAEAATDPNQAYVGQLSSIDEPELLFGSHGLS